MVDTILILENVGYLYDIQDFNIVETFGSGEHELNFTISKEHPYYKLIFEEMKITYKDNNAYVIKSIDEQQETANISCRLYLDELKAKEIIGYKQEKQSLSSLLDELLFLSGIGWMHEDANLIGIIRTNELDYGNTLDLLRLAQNTYKAVFEYDTINRIIKVIPIENYKNKGVYFTDELNLKEVYLRGDSFEYCTRLIPIGAEGLTIESVNQNKNYIENNDYSPKTITKIWKDERFTDPQSLKDEAIEKLKILSKPVRTYDLAIIDMASIDKDYESLKFNIGDKVTLIDRAREIKVEHQIVKLTRYPNEPKRNTAELNMSAKGFTNIVKGLIDGNAIITNIQGKRIAELKLDINTFSVTLKDYIKIGATIEYVGSQISAEKNRIDLIVESKSSTYMGQPESYSKGDTWIVEDDDVIEPYKKGDLLTASESNATYDPKNWSDAVRYGKDIITVKENVSAIELTVEGITSTVSSHETEIKNITDDATELKAFVEINLEELQKQVDGQITTFFYGYEPTLNNLPASEWITEDLQNNHAGDVFYNSVSGIGYRFSKVNNIWKWAMIKDTEVTKALADAQKAQDTADGKRRLFIGIPKPPYDVGDTWANATYGDYKDDLLVCIIEKADKASFHINDWRKATGYTDDTAVKNFINGKFAENVAILQDQIDQKAQTWRQETDPALKWTTPELKKQHVGDLWYNTVSKRSYIYSESYTWEEQEIPQEIFDKIDGKSSIYVAQPTNYSKGDMWIVEADNIIPPYKKGVLLTASDDSTTFDPKHWSEKVRYTDDIATTNSKVTTIEQTVGEIKLTVSETKEAVGVIDKRVGKAESSIIVNTEAITSRVTKTEINELTGQINDNFDTIDKRVKKAETIIDQNTEAITLKATKEEVTTTKKDLEAAIKIQANEISTKVSNEEFGSKITQNAKSVQIAWNNLSEYIQFINTQLQIKDKNHRLLMSLSQDGMNLYNENLLVGQFTTNYLGNSWEPIRGTAQTCNLGCYISWELVTSGGNELIMAYFDKNVDVYEKNMKTGLNIGKTTYFHQNPLVLDRSEQVVISANDGNMSIRHSISGSHSITFGGNAGAVFTNDGLNMMGNSITGVNILSYSSIQTKGRSVSNKGFLASYSSEKLHTHIDEIEIIAGENIIELPEFFKGQGLNYHVFLSKQGSGDIWYSDKTQENFIIHSENNMTVSYEIKFIITEQPVKQMA